MPFTVAVHSMQMPIPQKGARGSPRTESLQGSLDMIVAAATLVPSATQTGRPLIVIRNVSLIRISKCAPKEKPEPPSMVKPRR
jgi:hypothetical protein